MYKYILICKLLNNINILKYKNNFRKYNLIQIKFKASSRF